jgi:hypothetical protein
LGEQVYRDKPNFITFLKNKGLSPDDAEAMYYKAENRDPVADEYLNKYTNIKKPKFSGYSLPGGENYREIVLTLPTAYSEGSPLAKEVRGLGYKGELADLNASMIKGFGGSEDLMNRWMGATGNQTYRSSHWDEPNPLSHLRVSDRVTDGKKTLLVDEVQSDWHQAGREKGYISPDDRKPADIERDVLALEDRRRVLLAKGASDEEIKHLDEQGAILNQQWTDSLKNSNKIPDAPYKDDWYQLTLRRAIKEAIDGGYDRVALPTGQRVAERFDLSKQIDRIDYNKNDDGTYSMSAIKDGREVFAKENLDEKELSGIVGKDVAKKIVGDEGSSAPKADRWESEDVDEPEFKSLSGLDLSVGGEGMKKYYDEIYPGYLKKFGKKYGANTGKTMLDLDDGGAEFLHYMDITPAMRKEFSTGIHMKRGGKVQFAKSLDAMRHELTKAK